MIPFGVVVLDVLRHGATEVPLPDRNQSVEAFFFDRPHKAFRVGVRIGGALGNEHHVDPRVLESTSDITAPLPIPIADQDCGASAASGSAIVSVRTICCMNTAAGCGVDPRICTPREAKSMTNTV